MAQESLEFVMQSSLIPERPLIISPTLAATIGLEEAVLLHVLCELMAHRSCAQKGGLSWLELDQQSLLDALPFWAWIDIRRVQNNLQELGLLLVDANTGQDDSWRFAINQQNNVASSTASTNSTTGDAARRAPAAARAPAPRTPAPAPRAPAPAAQPRQRPQGGAEYIAQD